MSTLNTGTPTPPDAHEHPENSHDLEAILQAAIAQKSFGSSLEGLKYHDVQALKNLIDTRMDAHRADISQPGKIRRGILGRIGAIAGFATKSKKSSSEDYTTLCELNNAAYEVMMQKEEKEFDEAHKIMEKVVREMFPEMIVSLMNFKIGEINIAPTRKNHGYIQVGYDQSPEDMRDFIATHIDESRRINTEIEKEITVINEGREVNFALDGSAFAFDAHWAKQEVELKNQFPSRGLDVDDSIARIRELATTAEVKGLPKGTRIDISWHNDAYYGVNDHNLVIVLKGTESAGQNRVWIKKVLKKHESGALLAEEADRAVEDAKQLITRIDGDIKNGGDIAASADATIADANALKVELGKFTRE